ncbi:MAG: lysophospholipid acyltransferase family protein [Bryobacteraceae bacterium]
MRQRSRLRNAAEYAAARFLLATLALLPFSAALSLAKRYVGLLDRLAPKLRRTAFRNLEYAWPDLPQERREQIVNGVFTSIARLLAVMARFPRIHTANVGQWIRYEGFHHFEEALLRGKGVLFATAHLGNWELSAFAHALMAAPMHVVTRPLDNPLLEDLAVEYRSLSGNTIIGKKDFVRGILRALHSNQAVGILIDQNAGLDDGVFVDFFGHKASTSPSFAKLAARTGATIIPGYAVWHEDEGRYVLHFDTPIAMSGDALVDTQRLQSHLESVIRRYPDQWLWIHRRWKTRPAGEDPVY